MQKIYLGRQPILDDNSKIRAYEVFYRNSYKKSDIHGDRQASTSVITNILNRFGRKEVLGERRAFVKIDEKFLLSDLIFSVPSQFFVFTLLESIEMSERVVERIQKLYEKNYALVINDMKLDQSKMDKYRVIFDYLSFVKIDFSQSLAYGLEYLILELKSYDVRVIGTKIENPKSYNMARKVGCDWFQGYFFSKPTILEALIYEPNQMDVLRLYNLLMDGTNLDEITTEFENHPEIIVQLLQFISSGAFHFQSKISSIHHILTLVGRNEVAEWLMLMVYSKATSRIKEPFPLMRMIKYRAELMERLLVSVNPEAGSNMIGEAYLVGALSFTGTILNKKMEDFLESIHVSDIVKNALLHESDTLGEVYKAVKHIGDSDSKALVAFEKNYGLKEGSVKELVAKYVEEANKFEDSVA